MPSRRLTRNRRPSVGPRLAELVADAVLASGGAMLVAGFVASPAVAMAGRGADRTAFGPPPPTMLTPLPEPARQSTAVGPIPGDTWFSGTLSPTDPYDLAFMQVRPGRHTVHLQAYAPGAPAATRESGPTITLSDGARHGPETDAKPYTGSVSQTELTVYGPRLLAIRVGPYLADDARSGSELPWGLNVGPSKALITRRRPASYFAPATCKPTRRHLARRETLTVRCRHLHTGDPVLASWQPRNTTHADAPPIRIRRARRGRVRINTREVQPGRYTLSLSRGDDPLFAGPVTIR